MNSANTKNTTIDNNTNNNNNNNNNNGCVDDYQWLLDLNVKENEQRATNMLSSPSPSVSPSSSSLFSNYLNTTIMSNHSSSVLQNNYYDLLAKNLDANLAEADIESFKTEDIHSILNGIPAANYVSDLTYSFDGCCRNQYPDEMTTSLTTNSLLSKIDMNSSNNSEYSISIQTNENSNTNPNAEDRSATDRHDNSNSITLSKSDMLFSSIKDDEDGNNDNSDNNNNLSANRKLHYKCYSNDSLNEISDSTKTANINKRSLFYNSTNSLLGERKNFLFNCRPNKNNYTIAFEDSEQLFSSIESKDKSSLSTIELPSTNRPNNRLVTWRQLNRKSNGRLVGDLQTQHLFSTSLPNLKDIKNFNEYKNNLNLLNMFKCRKMQNLQTFVHSKSNDQCVQTSTFLGNVGGAAVIDPRSNIYKQPIYIVYPNYTLPNLDFIAFANNNCENTFVPKAIESNFDRGMVGSHGKLKQAASEQNYEAIINNVHSLDHIYDWKSLNYLLPKKFKKLLRKKFSQTDAIDSQNLSSGYRGSSLTTTATTTTTKTTTTTAAVPAGRTDGSLQSPTYKPLFVYKYDRRDKRTKRDRQPQCDSLSRAILKVPSAKSFEQFDHYVKTMKSDLFDEKFFELDIFKNDFLLCDRFETGAKNRFGKHAKREERPQPQPQPLLPALLQPVITKKSPLKNKMAKQLKWSLNTDFFAYDHSPNWFRKCILEKEEMARNVIESVNCILSEQNQCQKEKLILKRLCTSLHTIFNDSLKIAVDSPFGTLNSSVWQVIEAFSHRNDKSILSSFVSDLILKINSEPFLTSSVFKFNAFVIGLINIKSLSIWLKYAYNQTIVIEKFYEQNSFLLMTRMGFRSVRNAFDCLVKSVEQLSKTTNFEHFNLFYELHEIDSPLSLSSSSSAAAAAAFPYFIEKIKIKNRPKSLNIPFDASSLANFKNISFKDENDPSNGGGGGSGGGGGQFKKLQMKWEKLSTSQSNNLDKINEIIDAQNELLAQQQQQQRPQPQRQQQIPQILKSKIPRPISTPSFSHQNHLVQTKPVQIKPQLKKITNLNANLAKNSKSRNW